MGFLDIFNTILYEPILNLLFWFVDVIPGGDFGLAIVLTTIIVRLILFVPSMSQIKSQRAMQDVQPKIEAIRKQYANDREEMGRQLMQFYKQNKINPLSSCLPLLIQLPILIALYQVFIGGLNTNPDTHLLVADQLDHLYGALRATFASQPVEATLFGLVDLTAKHNIIIAALAAVLQWWQARSLMSRRTPSANTKANSAQMMSQQFAQYLLPAMTFIFGYQFPAGLGLYWVVSTIFSIVQQMIFFRRHTPPAAPPDAVTG